WRGVAAACIRMRVPMQLLDDAAIETGRRPNRGAELLNVFHTRDLLVGHLSTIFAAELDRPAHPAQVLLVSAASCALAAHLLRSYDAFGEKEVKIHGLGPRALSDVISYIEDNIEATITLESLAKLAHVSRFHFARLFKVSTDLTPMAFVEQARIRRAQALMMDSNLALSEIAIAVGFVDQSHFTRRFRLHAGCTPTEYAHSRGFRRLSGRKTSNLFDPIRTSTS
ncbi:MAG: AraC family transcriptional regulator, partial [Acidobacteriaceae bacterium]|nr:AraC family transcriptional regulator [Acidobacteriaceae bacterium]